MADCSDLFLRYDKTISLTKTDRKFLRAARNAIIKKIKKYFKEHENCPDVEFQVQGSFSMNTIIKPIEGEYDIDVGVYLRGYSNWQSDWPTAETASQWLVNALTNHTATPPVNKRSCVRLIYRPSTVNKDVAYHVDLPIYCEYLNWLSEKYTRIGVTGEKQWSQKSDPLGFTKWFFNQCLKNGNDKNQLIRLVKYIKAWKESIKDDVRFPSGMALTVMMAANYVPHDREDVSFQNTVAAGYNTIFTGFLDDLFNDFTIESPVEPYNDVIKRLNSEEKNRFKNALYQLAVDGKSAIEEEDRNKSEYTWKKHFDKRM